MSKQVNTSLGGGSLEWPDRIRYTGEPFLMISSKRYQGALSTAIEKSQRAGENPPADTKHVVRLLLPTSISSNDNLSYESFSSLMAAGVEDVANRNYGDAVWTLAMAATEKAQESLGIKDFATGMKAISLGKVTKTKEQLIFKAPTLRSHTFTFSMFPRGQEEAKNIATIIYTLKQLAYPTTTGIIGDGNTQFEFPHEFSVHMIPDVENAFPAIREAFLTSITTNLAGHGGRIGIGADGLFQSVELSLTFQDRRLQDDQSIV